MDPKFGKKYPRNVPKNLIPVHFESFFWGLSLANFGPVVAWEGRFENQKCKKIWNLFETQGNLG